MYTQTIRESETVIEGLVRAAVRGGAPAAVAEKARAATAARFPRGARRTVERGRVEAYFWGVVRRRALAGEAPAIARLIVAASLAAELREAGHCSEAIAQAVI